MRLPCSALSGTAIGRTCPWTSGTVQLESSICKSRASQWREGGLWEGRGYEEEGKAGVSGQRQEEFEEESGRESFITWIDCVWNREREGGGGERERERESSSSSSSIACRCLTSARGNSHSPKKVRGGRPHLCAPQRNSSLWMHYEWVGLQLRMFWIWKQLERIGFQTNEPNGDSTNRLHKTREGRMRAEEEMDGGEEALEQLRIIFNLCDSDRDGVISVDDFRRIGSEHFDKTQVSKRRLHSCRLLAITLRLSVIVQCAPRSPGPQLCKHTLSGGCVS